MCDSSRRVLGFYAAAPRVRVRARAHATKKIPPRSFRAGARAKTRTRTRESWIHPPTASTRSVRVCGRVRADARAAHQKREAAAVDLRVPSSQPVRAVSSSPAVAVGLWFVCSRAGRHTEESKTFRSSGGGASSSQARVDRARDTLKRVRIELEFGRLHVSCACAFQVYRCACECDPIGTSFILLLPHNILLYYMHITYPVYSVACCT